MLPYPRASSSLILAFPLTYSHPRPHSYHHISQLFEKIVRAIVSSLRGDTALRGRALKALATIVDVDAELLADVRTCVSLYFLGLASCLCAC